MVRNQTPQGFQAVQHAWQDSSTSHSVRQPLNEVPPFTENQQRETWRKIFSREYEYQWRAVLTYTVYIIILLWASMLTWYLFFTADSKQASLSNILNIPQMYGSPSIVIPYPASDFTDLGISIHDIKMNSTMKSIGFKANFEIDALSTSLFWNPEFGTELKRIVQDVVMNKEADIELRYVSNSQIDVKIKLKDESILSEMEKMQKNLKTGSIRSTFLDNERMQTLLKQLPQQREIDSSINGSLSDKMVYIIEGLPSANKMFMMSTSQLVHEVSQSLQRTQYELTKNLVESDKYQNKVYDLQNQIAEIEAQLQQAQNVIQSREQYLSNSISEFKNEILKVNQDADGTVNRESGLQDEINQLKEEIKQQHARHRELKQQIVPQYKSTIKNLQVQLEREQSKEKSLQNQGSHIAYEIAQIEKGNTQRHNQLILVQETIDNIAATIGIISETSQNYQTSKFNNTLLQIEENFLNHKRQILKNKQMIQYLDGQQKEHHKKGYLIDSVAERMALEIGSVSNQIEQVKEEISDVRELFTNQEEVKKSLTKNNENLKAQKSQVISRINQISIELSTQRLFGQSYKDLIDSLKSFAAGVYVKFNQILDYAPGVQNTHTGQEVLKVSTTTKQEL